MTPELQDQIIKERDAFFARIGRMLLQEDPAADTVLIEPRRPGGPVTPLYGKGFTKLEHGMGHFHTLDTRTGLIWSQTLDCGKVSHENALKAVARLNEAKVDGHTDWRLPEIRELLSLVDYSRAEPAIDVEHFPDTKSDWYWTASSCAGYPGYAWIVRFSLGDAYWSLRHGVAFVRAVRGPSARASQ